jgi:hypothetical protein
MIIKIDYYTNNEYCKINNNINHVNDSGTKGTTTKVDRQDSTKLVKLIYEYI